FDNTAGLSRDSGLLAPVEKRFSRRFPFLGSYALATNTGTNGTVLQSGRGIGFNSLNWFENYGPVARDLRHVASLSGFVDLPKQFQIALNAYFSGRSPFSVCMSVMD